MARSVCKDMGDMRSNLADECIDAVRARLLSFAGMSTHGAAMHAASTADILQVAGCNSSGQLYHRETDSASAVAQARRIVEQLKWPDQSECHREQGWLQAAC